METRVISNNLNQMESIQSTTEKTNNKGFFHLISRFFDWICSFFRRKDEPKLDANRVQVLTADAASQTEDVPVAESQFVVEQPQGELTGLIILGAGSPYVL